MDTLTHYQTLMQNLQEEYCAWYSQGEEHGVDLEVIADETHGQYQLMRVGWHGESRIRKQIFYVRLKNGKFWIEEDWTEEGIANELVRLGVPRSEIVLAFNPPEMRPYTEFAVA